MTDTVSDGPEPLDAPGSAEPTPQEGRRRHRARRTLLIVIGVVVVLFASIQLVPYRVDNPAVAQEPTWDSARTRQLAVAACYDCHSNETETYWWEDIAPVSWWITNHVKEGRAALNFSECTKGRSENEASEKVRDGSMPPSYYTWFGMHSNAKLTAAEKQELADGLKATLQGWDCGGEGGGG